MDKFFRVIVSLIIVFILAYLVWRFSSIVTYILISAVLSFVGQPLVKVIDKIRIGRFKMPHVLSALLTLIVMFAIFVAFVSIFVPLIASQITAICQFDFAQIGEGLKEPFSNIHDFLVKYNILKESETIESLISTQLESILSMATFTNLFSGLLGLTGSLFIGIFSVLFITFFFLKDEHLFYNGIMLFIPLRHKEQVSNALSSIRKLLSRYFIGLFIEVTTMMTLITLGCTILGVENALVIGFFGGLMNIIPYLGPIIGGTIGILIGVTTSVSMEL